MRSRDHARLIVDRSPAEPLTGRELRAWLAEHTVFVSSVMAGMAAERNAVADAIEELDGRVVLFERLGGRDDDAETAYLAGVRSSDVYVGILGERYGKPEPSGYSPTHLEYDEAVACGLRISVWTTTGEQDGRQQDFLAEVRTFHTTGSYATPEDLSAGVVDRLRLIAAGEASPWCKIGPVLFRAKSHTDDGRRIVVEASLRNDDVVEALESLRPGRFGGHGSISITCRGSTHPVRIEGVTVEVGAGRARRVRIEAVKEDHVARDPLGGMSFEGRSPEDLTDLALRVALFGEPNPLGSMASLAEMPDPLEPLRAAGLDGDSLGSAAETLLVEALVGTGKASRVTAVRMGPARNGRRRLRIEWRTPHRYTNVEPEIRVTEGEISA